MEERYENFRTMSSKRVWPACFPLMKGANSKAGDCNGSNNDGKLGYVTDTDRQ